MRRVVVALANPLCRSLWEAVGRWHDDDASVSVCTRPPPPPRPGPERMGRLLACTWTTLAARVPDAARVPALARGWQPKRRRGKKRRACCELYHATPRHCLPPGPAFLGRACMHAAWHRVHVPCGVAGGPDRGIPCSAACRGRARHAVRPDHDVIRSGRGGARQACSQQQCGGAHGRLRPAWHHVSNDGVLAGIAPCHCTPTPHTYVHAVGHGMRTWPGWASGVARCSAEGRAPREPGVNPRQASQPARSPPHTRRTPDHDGSRLLAQHKCAPLSRLASRPAPAARHLQGKHPIHLRPPPSPPPLPPACVQRRGECERHCRAHCARLHAFLPRRRARRWRALPVSHRARGQRPAGQPAGLDCSWSCPVLSCLRLVGSTPAWIRPGCGASCAPVPLACV